MQFLERNNERVPIHGGADTILTHSQSVRPDSDYYGDQSKLYADKRWVRFPFCEDDIVAQQVGDTLVLEE